MSDTNDVKECRYDYFVDKNNKICPENSEFKPKKVDLKPTELSSEPKIVDPSLWNSIGIWEERKFDLDGYKQFIHKNKGWFNSSA